MHELEVFCEMTFFDFKLPIFCTAFRATRPPVFGVRGALHSVWPLSWCRTSLSPDVEPNDFGGVDSTNSMSHDEDGVGCSNFKIGRGNEVIIGSRVTGQF